VKLLAITENRTGMIAGAGIRGVRVERGVLIVDLRPRGLIVEAKTERERFSIRTAVKPLPAEVPPPAPPSRQAGSQSARPNQTEDIK